MLLVDQTAQAFLVEDGRKTGLRAAIRQQRIAIEPIPAWVDFYFAQHPRPRLSILGNNVRGNFS
jgi:hypothetical protein